MTLNFRDNQNDKKIPQAQDKANQIKKGIKQRKPKARRPGRKRKEGYTKENEMDEKIKMVAPLQQELIALSP